MSRVAVVTDSAADLPPESAASAGIEIVPLTVAFGDEAFLDGVELPPKEFWARVQRGSALPTTASPAPAALSEAYERAAREGAAAVVSIHVSGALSRTVATAGLAAGEASVPVEVVDTRSVSAGQGLVALAAAEVAAADADLAAVTDAARGAVSRLAVAAALETVEFLRRGGRVGAARAALSELLRIRPVLSIDDGEPVVIAKTRTRRRAIEEVLARTAGPASAAAVFHSGAPEAQDVAERVGAATGATPTLGLIGAVTGTHLGPGAIGVAVIGAQ